MPNPPRPERPDFPDGKFDGDQMAWALDVIGWDTNYAARLIHGNASSLRQMIKGRRLIPGNLGDWLNLLATWHLRLWQPKRWPLNLPDEPEGPYRGADMKQALTRIGWPNDMAAFRLNLPYRFVHGMLSGQRVIPDGVSLWLEALAEMHETYPEPVGWRAKVPQDDWLAARGIKAGTDAA